MASAWGQADSLSKEGTVSTLALTMSAGTDDGRAMAMRV